MEAKVLYISKNEKSALIAVTQKLGPITNEVSGFVGIANGITLEVGQEISIPASRVIQRKSTTEDGTEFTHLSFE